MLAWRKQKGKIRSRPQNLWYLARVNKALKRLLRITRGRGKRVNLWARKTLKDSPTIHAEFKWILNEVLHADNQSNEEAYAWLAITTICYPSLGTMDDAKLYYEKCLRSKMRKGWVVWPTYERGRATSPGSYVANTWWVSPPRTTSGISKWAWWLEVYISSIFPLSFNAVNARYLKLWPSVPWRVAFLVSANTALPWNCGVSKDTARWLDCLQEWLAWMLIGAHFSMLRCLVFYPRHGSCLGCCTNQWYWILFFGRLQQYIWILIRSFSGSGRRVSMQFQVTAPPRTSCLTPKFSSRIGIDLLCHGISMVDIRRASTVG